MLNRRLKRAIDLMVAFARVTPGERGVVRLKDAARAACMSRSYGEQLAGRLSERGLLIAKHGPLGGYNLGATPDVITVRDIAFAIGEGKSYKHVKEALGSVTLALLMGEQ